MDFLTFEDREQDLPALILLAVSLGRNCPGSRLHLPARNLGSTALDWLGRQPNVVLHQDLWAERSGTSSRTSLNRCLPATSGASPGWTPT